VKVADRGLGKLPQRTESGVRMKDVDSEHNAEAKIVKGIPEELKK
jgi:hypothetical protein